MRELKEDTTPQEFVDASMFTAAAAATEADIASTLNRLLYDMKMVSERQDDLQVRLSSWPLRASSTPPWCSALGIRNGATHISLVCIRRHLQTYAPPHTHMPSPPMCLSSPLVPSAPPSPSSTLPCLLPWAG